MAILLSGLWLFTGVSTLGLLYSVSSWAGITWLLFDDWKLRKCNELGIDPESIKQVFDGNEGPQIRAARELGLYRTLGAKHVFELPEDDFTRKYDLAGSWLLLDTEVYLLADGMRHLGMLDGEGENAERLRALLRGTNVAYEDLSFLWEGFDCDFAKLKRLSKARQEDKEWVDLASWLMSRRASKA